MDVSQMQQTSEAQRRVNERQVRLLGEIGLLDWEIKQLTAQQEAKYREVDAMLRELPFAQQLERDLQAHLANAQASGATEATGANGILQSETVKAAAPVTVTPSASGGGAYIYDPAQFEAAARATTKPTRAHKKKAPTKRPAAKKPAAAKPAPVQAVAATPPKRGRGRPRKQPAATPPPPVDITPAHAGNGTDDLDAAFGAM